MNLSEQRDQLDWDENMDPCLSHHDLTELCGQQEATIADLRKVNDTLSRMNACRVAGDEEREGTLGRYEDALLTITETKTDDAVRLRRIAERALVGELAVPNVEGR